MIISMLRLLGHQNWIMPGIRKRFIWAMINLLGIQDFDFETDFYGFTYRGNTRNYIERFVYYFGAYEKGLLLFMGECLSTKKDKVFVDIGSNIGHHSIFASKFAREVHSFEPYHVVRQRMLDNMKLNQISNIAVHPFGLGEAEATIPFFEPPQSNLGGGSFLATFSEDNKHKGLNLEIKNGDSILLNLDRIDVMKIDVEGFETSVLKGLIATIKKFRPIIIMEYTVQTKEKLMQEKELLELLTSTYTIKRFRNPNDIPYQFSDGDFEKAGLLDLAFIPKT
jgi:FkbM family methyltransferase